MAASFPGSVFTTTAQQNNVSTVNAEDVNITYDELVAIENELGTNPSDRVDNWGTGTFSSASKTFSTVGSRIQNVENGVYTVANSYVTKAGGSQIIPAVASTVGLEIRAQTSQSANLLEVKNSSGTVATAVNSAGYIAVIDGGSA
jgi:hypothetical protein